MQIKSLLLLMIVSCPFLSIAQPAVFDTMELNGVAGGNNKFVVIDTGTTGKIITSSDGITWTWNSLGITYDFYGGSYSGIIYGNNEFMINNGATGTNSIVLTSPDGSTWTGRSIPTTQGVTCVAYGNNKFVACGYLGTVSYSSDAANWTNLTIGWNVCLCAAWGNNEFITVDRWGNALTSPDGVTWNVGSYGTTFPQTPNNTGLCHIQWGNGVFVAVSAAGWIETSSNATSWTSISSGISDTLNAITWGNNKFVVVGTNGTIITSPTGSTWTRQTSNTNNTLRAVTWNGNLFVAVGSKATILTSPDGIIWTKRSITTTPPPVCSFYVNDSILQSGYKFWKGLASGTYSVQASITNPPASYAIIMVHANGSFYSNMSTNISGTSYNNPDFNPSAAPDSQYKFRVIKQYDTTVVYGESPVFYCNSLPKLSISVPNTPLVIGQNATVTWSVTGGIKGLTCGGWTGNIRLQWYRYDTLKSYALDNQGSTPVDSFRYTFTVPSAITGTTLPGDSFIMAGCNAPTGTSIPDGHVWGFSSRFKIVQQAVPPLLSSPSNGSAKQPTSLTLHWGTVSGATSYSMRISTTSSFSTTFANQSGLSAGNTKASSLALNTRYYWEVNTTNAGGTSIWSSVWSFTTVSTAVLPQQHFSGAEVIVVSIQSGTLRYTLPVSSQVNVTYYDFKGRFIASFINEFQTAGGHSFRIPASSWAKGTYLQVFKAGNIVLKDKFVLVQ